MTSVGENIQGRIYRRALKEGVLVDVSYKEFLNRYDHFFKFYDDVIDNIKSPTTVVLGLQGAIGIGKTTLAKLFTIRLQEQGFAAETISLDDFYLSKSERERIAELYKGNALFNIHRCMPGSHNVRSLHDVINDMWRYLSHYSATLFAVGSFLFVSCSVDGASAPP